jgi:hypothetical protein
VTLATRRWGPRVGGLLTALPVVTGPTLCFYALEQGPRFAARASTSTLLALTAVAVYAVTYAHTALRRRWPVSLGAGWAVFVAVTAVLYQVHVGASMSLGVVIAACVVGHRLLPVSGAVPAAAHAPVWDVPLRMVTAGALVLTLTSVAGWLGPNLSGLLTPFPLATAIIAAFTHAQRGTNAVVAFFRGFLPALITFAVFCYVLSLALLRVPIAVSILLALSAQLLLQGALYTVAHRR